MEYVVPKDPGEILEYLINWSGELTTGETISTSAFTVPTGITKDSESNTTTTSTVWLSGGTAGREYIVTCTVTTSSTPARTYRKEIVVPVTKQ